MEYEMSMRQAVEADVARLRKLLDDTNVIRLQLESEIESLREELINLRMNHKTVRRIGPNFFTMTITWPNPMKHLRVSTHSFFRLRSENQFLVKHHSIIFLILIIYI